MIVLGRMFLSVSFESFLCIGNAKNIDKWLTRLIKYNIFRKYLAPEFSNSLRNFNSFWSSWPTNFRLFYFCYVAYTYICIKLLIMVWFRTLPAEDYVYQEKRLKRIQLCKRLHILFFLCISSNIVQAISVLI